MSISTPIFGETCKWSFIIDKGSARTWEEAEDIILNECIKYRKSQIKRNL